MKTSLLTLCLIFAAYCLQAADPVNIVDPTYLNQKLKINPDGSLNATVSGSTYSTGTSAVRVTGTTPVSGAVTANIGTLNGVATEATLLEVFGQVSATQDLLDGATFGNNDGLRLGTGTNSVGAFKIATTGTSVPTFPVYTTGTTAIPAGARNLQFAPSTSATGVLIFNGTYAIPGVGNLGVISIPIAPGTLSISGTAILTSGSVQGIHTY